MNRRHKSYHEMCTINLIRWNIAYKGRKWSKKCTHTEHIIILNATIQCFMRLSIVYAWWGSRTSIHHMRQFLKKVANKRNNFQRKWKWKRKIEITLKTELFVLNNLLPFLSLSSPLSFSLPPPPPSLSFSLFEQDFRLYLWIWIHWGLKTRKAGSLFLVI